MKKIIYLIFSSVSACFFTCCINEGGSSSEIENYVVVEDRVPGFSVYDPEGAVVDFSSEWFEGKRSVIVFFRSVCPDCQRELPKVYTAWEELHHAYEFILVSRGETADSVAAYWESESASKTSFTPMPYYLDPDAVAFNKFANSYVPRLYLVGTDGRIKLMEIEHFSSVDGENLIKLIKEIL